MRPKKYYDYLRRPLATLLSRPVTRLRLFVDHYGLEPRLEAFPQHVRSCEIYEFFMVSELPRSAWRTYRTLVGPIPMRTARAIAVIGDVKHEVFVETPLYEGGKRLAGRELLNRFILVLDGPLKSACVARRREAVEDSD